MTATVLNPAGGSNESAASAAQASAGRSAVRGAGGSANRHATRVDARGCPVNTNSQAAIDHVEKATWRLASYFGDPIADLDAAIAEDPAWIMPHLMKANGLLSMAEHRFAALARETLQQAIALNAGRGLQPREQSHLAATEAALAGHWHTACDLWERILVDQPQDMAALLPAHLFDFYRGDSLNLRKRSARVLPDWSESAPLYSFVLGQYAFGLEECNLYAQAREVGQRALSLNPMDPWAIHAIAHVHEMQGQYEEGAAWLSSREQDWAPGNSFAFHNWWHLALFHLEKLDTRAALGILDDQVAPGAEIALQYLDVAALLWRLSLMDVDVGDRWSRLAPSWPVAAPEAGFYSFNDLHAVLTQAGAGRVDLAHRVIDAVAGKAGESSTCGTVAASTGLPLLRAVIATVEGRHNEAVEGLLAIRDTSFRFGGSHAQRDLIEQTLLAASIRAGRRSLARHLLNERVMVKPRSPLTEYWAQRIS